MIIFLTWTIIFPRLRPGVLDPEPGVLPTLPHHVVPLTRQLVQVPASHRIRAGLQSLKMDSDLRCCGLFPAAALHFNYTDTHARGQQSKVFGLDVTSRY